MAPSQHADGKDQRKTAPLCSPGEAKHVERQDGGEKDPGMATPTKLADRNPKAATTTIMTRTAAEITLFRRSASLVSICFDRSWK